MSAPESSAGLSTSAGSDAKAEAFEFTAEENRVLERLATKMNFVGLFAVGIAVVMILLGITLRDPSPAVNGLLAGLIGFWTARASRQFLLVARTRGHDVSHLMAALDDLRKLYTLQYWVCFAALVIAIVVLTAQVVGG